MGFVKVTIDKSKSLSLKYMFEIGSAKWGRRKRTYNFNNKLGNSKG